MKNISLLFLVMSLIISSCKKDDIKYGDLIGIVQNEFGQVLVGAIVKIASDSTLTDNDGKYLFKELPTREYTVSVTKEFYLSKTQKVFIISDVVNECNFTLQAGQPVLNISDTSLNVNAEANYFYIKIISNSAWTIENSSNWVTSSSEIGYGNDSIKIQWLENIGDMDRFDTVYFETSNIKKILTIKQSFPIKLVKYEGIIGNKEKNISDSVYLLFNKPIIVEKLISNWELCICDVNYNLIQNNFGIKLTFSCANLGGTYPFTISLSDGIGNFYSERIEVPFYKSKLNVLGSITDFLLINEDKEVLISSTSPSRLIRYSIIFDSILQIYDLPDSISPINLTYNPYNSKIYILTIDSYTIDEGLPNIFTLDLPTGQIVEEITIKPDEGDHPIYPHIIPYDLGFTSSGLGIVLLRANGNSGQQWRVIDCANNDSTYIYSTTNSYSFSSVHMIHNESKLILGQSWGDYYYGLFDGNTQQFSILSTLSTSSGRFVATNRRNDNIFIGQDVEQYIMNLNGYQSQISHFNFNYGCADFSYKSDDNQTVYFCDENYFNLIDYNTAQILMSSQIIQGIKNITSTIDGKYALAFALEGDNSNLYIFETECFYRYLR